jgi:hypothetical protein
MGKAANNEKRKLKANLFNNVSAGLFVGGVIVPYLAIIQDNLFPRSVSYDEFAKLGWPAIAMAIALIAAKLLHSFAAFHLDDLED